MKYLCLICAETVIDYMSEAEARQHYDEYMALASDLQQDGRLLGANRLLPAETATTVRVRDGKISTTDGPFVETKEQLGGYFLIEAKDMDEAIAIAARIPGASIGCVEVRPVAEDTDTLHAIGQLQA